MNWPRSLLARNALLIVALIVLGQLGGALLMRQMVVLPRMAQTADGVARTLGAIRAGLEKLGQPIGVNDLHIAAHARSEGLVMVTNNVGEFARVPALQVEIWVDTNQ